MKEKGQWKIRYWADEAQPNGSVRRVQRTKCLGRLAELNFSQACRARDEFLGPVNSLEVGIEHSRRTMADLISRWKTDVKPTFRKSTQLQYTSLMSKWIEPRLGSRKVSEVERADVQGLLTEAGRELAYESVKGLRKVVRHLFTVAEEWEWIRPGSNPTKARLRLPQRACKRPPRILTPQQVSILLAALPEPHATVVRVAVFCGLRKGELEALRRNDLVDEGLRVDEAIYYRQVGAPKTDRSSGVVPLGPRTRQALEQWMAVSRFKGPEAFIFSTKAGKPVDLHNSIRRVVKPTCRKLGLPEISWHDLRRTFTTWGRRAGVKAETMRDLLRHTDVKMTLGVYSQVSDGAEAVAEIENLLPLDVTPETTVSA